MVEVSLWQAPNSQWKRRSSVVELQDVQSSTLRKNRDLIKKCLEIIAKEWNAELVLNPRGICSFQCGGFVVVIDVPWDSKAFFLYTSIMKCLKSSTTVMQKALELNYLTQATSGCTLSLDPNKSQEMEIVLCRSQRVDGTNHHHLISLFKNLLRTAVTVQKQLEKAQRSQVSIIGALPLHQPTSATSGSDKSRQAHKDMPPAPRLDMDSTPTISNKTLDKNVAPRFRKNSIANASKMTLKDCTKTNNAFEMAANATTSKYEYAFLTKASSIGRSSNVMRSLSRIASKHIARARGPSGRICVQQETIHRTSVEELNTNICVEV